MPWEFKLAQKLGFKVPSAAGGWQYRTQIITCRQQRGRFECPTEGRAVGSWDGRPSSVTRMRIWKLS